MAGLKVEMWLLKLFNNIGRALIALRRAAAWRRGGSGTVSTRLYWRYAELSYRPSSVGAFAFSGASATVACPLRYEHDARGPFDNANVPPITEETPPDTTITYNDRTR